MAQRNTAMDMQQLAEVSRPMFQQLDETKEYEETQYYKVRRPAFELVVDLIGSDMKVMLQYKAILPSWIIICPSRLGRC